MPARSPFDYATLRVVPHVEREEFINVGVVLLCRPRRFLGMRLAVDEDRLRCLAVDLDLAALEAHLAGMRRISEGDPAGGPIARLSQAERFHWLVAPSSTIVQPSPVHSGLCDKPGEMLEALLAELVLPPAPAATPDA